jgi:tetratricopeptide (TPR) repeat protein
VLGRLRIVLGDTPETLARVAANHLKLGRQDRALHYFEKALAGDGGFAPALVGAGAIYGNRGDLKRAAEYSRRAIASNPVSVKAYQNLAAALARLSELREALAAVESGLVVAPDDATLSSMKQSLLRAMSEPETP